MTQAAFELQNSDVRIIDLALKYGYESPDSFTRAFHKIHGAKSLPPSGVKERISDIMAEMESNN